MAVVLLYKTFHVHSYPDRSLSCLSPTSPLFSFSTMWSLMWLRTCIELLHRSFAGALCSAGCSRFDGCFSDFLYPHDQLKATLLGFFQRYVVLPCGLADPSQLVMLEILPFPLHYRHSGTCLGLFGHGPSHTFGVKSLTSSAHS